MRSRRYPLVLLILLVAIAIVNYLAVLNSWYWKMRWFDMPMHFAGGMWLGATMLWWKFFSGVDIAPQRTADMFLWAIAGAFIVGLGWEVYEGVVALLTKGYMNGLADTLSDILLDLLGALTVSFGVLMWKRK